MVRIRRQTLNHSAAYSTLFIDVSQHVSIDVDRYKYYSNLIMATSRVTIATCEVIGGIKRPDSTPYPLEAVLSVQVDDARCVDIIDARIPRDAKKEHERCVALDSGIAGRLSEFCVSYFGADADHSTDATRFQCHSSASFWMGRTATVSGARGISAFRSLEEINAGDLSSEDARVGHAFAIYEPSHIGLKLRHTYVGLGYNALRRQRETLSVNGPNGTLLIAPPETMAAMYGGPNAALYRLG